MMDSNVSSRKILAFAASSSKHSINRKLIAYATSLLAHAEVDLLDLNDFEMPMYSEDKEKEIGKPNAVDRFLLKIQQADAIFISFAEHNGSYTVAYKNIFDWCSRFTKKVYENKKVVVLSTSPGPRGAASVLDMAVKSMPFFGAQVIGHLSIPSFYENFDLESQSLKNEILKQQLQDLVNKV